MIESLAIARVIIYVGLGLYGVWKHNLWVEGASLFLIIAAADASQKLSSPDLFAWVKTLGSFFILVAMIELSNSKKSKE